MSDKSKEKRKGSPQRRLSTSQWLGLALCLLLMVAVIRLLNPAIAPSNSLFDPVILPTQRIGEGSTLVNFAASYDKIALAWKDDRTQNITIGTVLMSGLKLGHINAEYISRYREESGRVSLGIHPLQSLIFYLDDHRNLHADVNIQQENVLTAAYSPNGTLFAMLYPSKVRLLDLQRWPQFSMSHMAGTILLPSKFIPHDMIFGPDDTLAIIGVGLEEGTTLLLYDLETLEIKAQVSLPYGRMMTLASHPAMPEIAAVVDSVVYRLDTIPGATQSFSVPLEHISFIDYDESGLWLAVTGVRAETHQTAVYLYDLKSTAEMPPPLSALTETPPVKGQFINGGLLIGETGGQFTFWQWQGEAWKKTNTWPLVLNSVSERWRPAPSRATPSEWQEGTHEDAHE